MMLRRCPWLLCGTVLTGFCVAGCGGGSTGTNPPVENTKRVYEGPGFSDDETGGVAYTNTEILVRPPNQNEGRFGQVNGTLSRTDKIRDRWFYDWYTFTAIDSGERVLTLESRDFDPVIAVFRVYPDGYWEFIELDDDDGEGTNARITLSADRNANYVVTVTSYRQDDTGDYTLSFEQGLSYVTTRKNAAYPFASPRRD